jgi:hypothetical protein
MTLWKLVWCVTAACSLGDMRQEPEGVFYSDRAHCEQAKQVLKEEHTRVFCTRAINPIGGRWMPSMPSGKIAD